MAGECVVVKVPDGVRVDRADPHVLISLDLLASLRGSSDGPATVTDHELVIDAVNGRFRYEVGDWVSQLEQARFDELLVDTTRAFLHRSVMGHRVEPQDEVPA